MKKEFTVVEFGLIALLVGLVTIMIVMISQHSRNSSAAAPESTQRIFPTDTSPIVQASAKVLGNAELIPSLGLYDMTIEDPGDSNSHTHAFSVSKPIIGSDGYVQITRYRPSSNQPDVYWFVIPTEKTATSSRPEE